MKHYFSRDTLPKLKGQTDSDEWMKAFSLNIRFKLFNIECNISIVYFVDMLFSVEESKI